MRQHDEESHHRDPRIYFLLIFLCICVGYYRYSQFEPKESTTYCLAYETPTNCVLQSECACEWCNEECVSWHFNNSQARIGCFRSEACLKSYEALQSFFFSARCFIVFGIIYLLSGMAIHDRIVFYGAFNSPPSFIMTAYMTLTGFDQGNRIERVKVARKQLFFYFMSVMTIVFVGCLFHLWFRTYKYFMREM